MTAIRRVSEIAILVLILLAQGLSGYAYNILSIGDSLTEGYPTAYSYRDSLYTQLSSHNYQFDFIGPNNGGAFADNQYLGQGGTRIDSVGAQGQDSLRTQLFAGKQDVELADVVLVHIGTNDLAKWWETPDPLTYYNQLTSVLTDLISYNLKVDILLAQIIKTEIGGYYYNNGTWGKIEAYNDFIVDKINSWAATVNNSWTGVIKLVDMESKLNYSALTGDFAGSGDDLHPNNGGYDKMGLAWYSALQDPELLGAPVPLPIPGVLLASGIMGLVAIRRRFKS